MKTVFRFLILLIATNSVNEVFAQCPVSYFTNPSFEGTPQPHIPPSPWMTCMPNTTPDTQPGIWGLLIPPTDGNSYLGLVQQTSTGWYEGAAQQLSSPLVSGSIYKFTIDLANIFTIDTSFEISPGCAELQIWGGFGLCHDADSTGALLWSSGNIAPYDTWITDTVTLAPAQNFTWVMFRINGLGCSDGPYIIVDNMRLLDSSGSPDLNITDSSFTSCPGSGVTLGGTPTTSCRYEWTGGGLNSAAVNPVVYPTVSASYHVRLTDTITGCTTSGNTMVVVTVPPPQSICLVTVDSNSTHNIVIWEKSDREATDSFHIFREISTNNYSQIAAIHGDSLSEFHDYGANPNSTGYRYKISVRDTCQNESALSPYHNTVHVQYLGAGNLIWNVYDIENQATPVSTFDILYDTIPNGNWQVMVTLPGSQNTVTDIGFSQHPNALYRVSTNFAFSCTPGRSASSSLSNITSSSTTGYSIVSSENLIRVFPNPAVDELQFITEGIPIESVRVYSVDGKLTMNIRPGADNVIDISGFDRGIYISEIAIAGEIRRIRWVKL